jgi:hypothetical protein
MRPDTQNMRTDGEKTEGKAEGEGGHCESTTVDVSNKYSETSRNVHRDCVVVVSRTRNIPLLLEARVLSPRTTCSS